MNTARTIWLVARREFKARMLTKANIISLAVILTLILAGSIIASYFLNKEHTVPTIHLVVDDSAADLVPFLETTAQQSGYELDFLDLTEGEAQAILAGDVKSAFPLDAFIGGNPSTPDVTVANPDDMSLQGVIVASVQSYALTEAVVAIGGDPDALRQELAKAQPTIDSPTPSESERFGPEYAVSMVALIVLLFVLINGGAMIAMSVVEEKTSRVVEILLSTIKPTQLLAGKILGVGLYGLFQIAVLGGSLIAAVTALGLVDEIPINLGWTFSLIVLWFLLGYAIFSLLFGAFGSLVSRYEEIGAVTTPLTFLVLIPFYVSIYLVPFQPDSTLVRLLSQIPFMSPFMVTIRNAMGSITWWEMASAIFLALVTIPALVWLAARLYRRGVLHTEGRLKFLEALRRAK